MVAVSSGWKKYQKCNLMRQVKNTGCAGKKNGSCIPRLHKVSKVQSEETSQKLRTYDEKIGTCLLRLDKVSKV